MQQAHDIDEDTREGEGQVHHINFWSQHEAASRNPEAEVRVIPSVFPASRQHPFEQPHAHARDRLHYKMQYLQAEKAAQLRKRGDPKTQTSDARFDERFAVLHGHTGQAPWYARRTTAMYSDDPAGVNHDRSAALMSVRSVLNKDQQAQPQQLLVPRPRKRGTPPSAALELQCCGGRDLRDSPVTNAICTCPAGAQGNSYTAAADNAAMRQASERAQSAMGRGDVSRPPEATRPRRSLSPERASPHSRGKQASEKKHKRHKKRSRERGRERSHTRSPEPSAARVSRRKGHGSKRRRRGGRSGSSSDSEAAGAALPQRSAAGGGGFEALRRERLERERAEAQRSRQLLREHFGRS